MGEESKVLEKIEKIIGTIWVIILVFLWVSYPFLPGDIFFWMWVAIIWSIAGGIMGLIFYLIKRIKK
ncbi:MAG: hypothetical protein ACFFDK_00165 [Promethearchaeota archaeon]